MPFRSRHRRAPFLACAALAAAPCGAAAQAGGTPAQAPSAAPATPSGPVAARMLARKSFFDAAQQAALELVGRSAAPVDVAVQLVRARDGASIAWWRPGILQPGTPTQVTWNGMAGGRLQREGRYEFRVFLASTPGTAGAAQDADAGPVATGTFLFLRHAFPIQGPHDFGTEGTGFGADRGGRAHQGQDVAAPCGTPLLAARGGTVRWSSWQERAGNYVIIDGARTGIDYVYMHLQAPALVAQGARVRTGQVIGHVGDTGVAHGCHLHFELWRAPGWYRGGEAFDPLPSLRAWDRSS